MTTIILYILIQLALAYIWFKAGYAKREQEFQNNSVQFNQNNIPALLVIKKTSEYEVRVLTKKLVKIID